MQAHI